MTSPWGEIKEIIEKIETEKHIQSASLQEQQEGYFSDKMTLSDKHSRYLGFLGGISVGILGGILTLIINYGFFVYFLHIEF